MRALQFMLYAPVGEARRFETTSSLIGYQKVRPREPVYTSRWFGRRSRGGARPLNRCGKTHLERDAGFPAENRARASDIGLDMPLLAGPCRFVDDGVLAERVPRRP